MTTREGPRQSVRILSEIPQVTFPTPGQPKTVMAVTYQVDAGPPRTIFIDEDKLPDVVWRRTHPEGPEPPAEEVRQGDQARREKIRADIERRRAVPPARTLEI
ncbi:MAG: hypothetical protein ACE5IA_02350 [Dehalococcoidia bacterium]